MSELRFDTRCVKPKSHIKDGIGAHATPLYQTSAFVFESAEQGAARFSGKEKGYIYTRLGNPTVHAFEEKVAAIEGAEAARGFATGLAAVTNTVIALSKHGDRIVAGDVLYGGTDKVLRDIIPDWGREVVFVDTSNPENIRKAMNERTSVVYLETPANPTMKLTDIEAISKIAHEGGAVVVVDNTFSTPVFQRPLELGADVALHSCTKYICGHGDVVAGVVACSNELAARIDPVLKNAGATLAPFDAWLLIRGIKTLHIRMAKHDENGRKVAEFLANHPKVEKIYYPGLSDHPQFELAKRQMTGFGGMISFELKGGLEAGRKLINSVKLCVVAVSLGDVETLIQHPASMTHAVVPKADREAGGLTDGMVRISCGIEDCRDIIDDLEQALERV